MDIIHLLLVLCHTRSFSLFGVVLKNQILKTILIDKLKIDINKKEVLLLEVLIAILLWVSLLDVQLCWHHSRSLFLLVA